MRHRFTKKDVETLDFIQHQMMIIENCDSFGMADLEKKSEMCDRARDLLHEFSEIITHSMPK